MPLSIPGQTGVVAVPVPGPRGPSGGEGFIHNQTTPAATWTVNHDLGRKPLSIQLEVASAIVLTDFELPDDHTVVVTFPSPTAGTLYLV